MKAVGYIRCSTNEQATSGLGLEAQVATLENAARRFGVQLVHVYQDAGISGSSSLEERPGLLDAVEALENGDWLLVTKRDRVGRDLVGVAMIERLIERKGAKIISALEEGTNGDDPTSILMKRLLDAFSEYERLLIGSRTKAALRAKKARGERVGNPPYGFEHGEDGELVPERREQRVIEAVKVLRAKGCSLRRIVKELKSHGITGRRGRPVRLALVHAISKRLDEERRAS